MIVLESLTLGVPGGMAGIGVGAPTAPRLGEILARLLELTCGLELTAGPMDWVQAAATVAGAGVFCAVCGPCSSQNTREVAAVARARSCAGGPGE